MKAAILEKIGAPLTVANIDFDHVEQLDRGQVLVKVLCTGICGSQLQEIDGIKGDPSHCPHLLGHEGCGIVQAIGADVATVKHGDKVVMHWRKGAGIEAKPATYQWDGIDKPLRWVKAGPITTFSEYAIVSENRVTAVPQDVPNDYAALLGCALSTALAIVDNEVLPLEPNTVFVIGCGGIGLALVLALKAAGIPHVLAHDVNVKKRQLVEKLGGLFLNNLAGGLDVVIDTIGDYKHIANRHYISLQKGGTSAGGFVPDRDIPRYIANKPKGWTNLITHRIHLDLINNGIRFMRQGRAGRVMIEMR